MLSLVPDGKADQILRLSPDRPAGTDRRLTWPQRQWKNHAGAGLVAMRPDKAGDAVSATTRPPRPKSRMGTDYWFLTDAEFRKRWTTNDFIEHAEVFSSRYLYGTLGPNWTGVEARMAGLSWKSMSREPGRLCSSTPMLLRFSSSTPSPAEFERRSEGSRNRIRKCDSTAIGNSRKRTATGQPIQICGGKRSAGNRDQRDLCDTEGGGEGSKCLMNSVKMQLPAKWAADSN